MGTKAGKPAEAKILLITKQDFANPRDGGAMRTHSVYNQLVNRGMDVTAISVEAQDEPGNIRSSSSIRRNLWPKIRVFWNYVRIGSFSSIRWFRPSMVDRILDELSTGRTNCAVIEYTQLMGYACLFDVPCVLDMHNIESELLRNYAKSSSSAFRRLAAAYEARRLIRLEHRLPKMVQLLSTVSSHDAEIAETWKKGHSGESAKIILAANGVSDVGFLVKCQRREEVVFVAHLGWQPNIDAAKWLANQVWPLVLLKNPRLQLRLIGRAPSDEVLGLARPGISVHGDVQSVVEHVAAARVATAPLLAAGGTRLKILEALSCGTPVVATSLGVLGLEGLAGPSLAVADSASEFADEVVRLADHERDRKSARELVEAYRWPTTLRQLGEEVESLASMQNQARIVGGAGQGRGPSEASKATGIQG